MLKKKIFQFCFSLMPKLFPCAKFKVQWILSFWCADMCHDMLNNPDYLHVFN
jgi:hypothetical protein